MIACVARAIENAVNVKLVSIIDAGIHRERVRPRGARRDGLRLRKIRIRGRSAEARHLFTKLMNVIS